VLGAGSVGSAIAGLVYGVEEFVFLAMAVGVLFAVGALSMGYRRRASRRTLRLVVRVPVAEVTAQQSAVVELTVTNTGNRRRPPVLVEDPSVHWAVSHPGLSESSLAGARAHVTPRNPAPSGGWWDSSATRRDRAQRAHDRRAVSRARRLPGAGPGPGAMVSIPVPTGDRGLLTLSDLGVWCQDPFGLVASRVAWAPPAHVIVYPAAPVMAAPRPAGAQRAGRERSSTAGTTNALSGDELSGLRPYAPGDRLTRLHWPSLARSGELVVREFLEPPSGSLTLLVDLRPSAHSAASIETTISRTAAFGLDALAQGVTVELCTSTGDRLVIAPDAAGRPMLLRALALLGPAQAPPAVTHRWGDRPRGGAVWATPGLQGNDVVLVTTAAGAAQRTLPEALSRRAETVLVP